MNTFALEARLLSLRIAAERIALAIETGGPVPSGARDFAAEGRRAMNTLGLAIHVERTRARRESGR